ncbi:MAG: hypothetical protein M1554_01385 [Patescibacteria group bacterium]|jgi:hypothetical protein|nr:hypothetical protein [Patescibacteria group bacterium]
MKQNDILSIIVTAIVAIVASIILSNYLFSSNPSTLNEPVYQIPTINDRFPIPSKKYFNAQSIDPTQIINIGPGNNTNIFNNSGN